MSHHRNTILTVLLGVAIFGASVLFFALPNETLAKEGKTSAAAQKIQKLLNQSRSKWADKHPISLLASTRALAASDLNDPMDFKNASSGDGALQGTQESDLQLQMPNTILMPDNPVPSETPAPSPTQTHVPTPTPATVSKTTRQAPKPTPTPAVQAQATSQKKVALNLPLRDAASQVIEQVTTDLPSIPSQPIIDTLSQNSNFTDYYSWDRLDKKTMYNFLALAAFLGALGLLFMSGAFDNLRNRNRQTQSFAPSGITPSEL